LSHTITIPGWRHSLQLSTIASILLGSQSLHLLATTQAVTRPELVLQTGHNVGIGAIAYSSDGRWLVSGGLDGTLKLWDATAGMEISTYSNHSEWISGLDFSWDGKLIASASRQGTVRVWDTDTQSEKFTFVGAGSQGASVAFSRTGKWLASGSQTASGITLWSLDSGKQFAHFPGFSFVFSADETLVAFSLDPGTTEVADVSTGRELMRFPTSRPISFSPDGRQLATYFWSQEVAGRVQMWDIHSGALVRTLAQFDKADPVSVVAFSPRWDYLASGGNGTVALWSVATGYKLWDANATAASPVTLNGISALAFQPNGHILASASWDNSISYWDIETGKLVLRSGQKADILRQARVSPDQRWLATVSVNQSGMVVWDLKGDSGIRRFGGSHRPSILTLDNTGASWESLMAFSADSRSLATAQGNTIVIWDIASGRVTNELVGPISAITSVVFSANGKWLASGGGDSAARVWSLDSRGEIVSVHPPSTARGVVAVGFTAGARELVVLSRAEKRLTIWKLPSGEQTLLLKSDLNNIDSASISNDGRRLAVVDAVGHSIRVLDIASGSIVKIDLARQPLSFSQDGKLIAAMIGANRVEVADSTTGRVIRTLGVDPGLNALSFSPNGRLLTGTTASGSAVMYDSVSGKHLLTLASSWHSDDWVAVAPDGLFDGSPNGMEDLLVWKFGRGLSAPAPVEIFLNEFYEPGLMSNVIGGARPRATRPIGSIDRRQPQIRIVAGLSTADPAERLADVTVKVAEARDERHARGTGVRDVRLFRDGLLVHTWRGDLSLDEHGEATLQTIISVKAGVSRLSAYAFSHDNIKSGDSTFALTRPLSTEQLGTAYLIVVGIDHYDNREFDLKYAVADANDLATTLQKAQESLGRFRRVETVRLLDKMATRSNILQVLRRLAGPGVESQQIGQIENSEFLRPARPEDAVFFYFAGHGTAVGRRYYLVPEDLGYSGSLQTVSPGDFRTILSHSISDRQLEAAFEGIDAGTVVFIVDSCNSGQTLSAEDSRRGPMNSFGLAQLAYEKGMYILTAAESYQAASESSRFGHGYLTYALVEEGLTRGAADVSPRDGQISLREWLTYPTVRVPELQSTRGAPGRALEHPTPHAGVAADSSSSSSSRQQPRVFYRRDFDPGRFLIAQRSQMPSESSAPEVPTLEQLLKDMGIARASIRTSYEVAETTGSDTVPGLQIFRRKATTLSAYGLNGKFRIETTNDDPLQADRTILMSDGKNTWTYYGERDRFHSNTYSKESVVPASFAIGSNLSGLEKVPNLRISGEDVVEVEGKKISCYVLESESKTGALTFKRTYWIDKARKAILRSDFSSVSGARHSEGSEVFTTVRFNQPLDEALFLFTPPAGAREVLGSTFRQAFRPGGTSRNFKLRNLEDNDVDSTTLRNKIVVLTFWISSCLPCQDQLTVISNVVSGLKNKDDLVVFGVNHEVAGVAARFLGENRLSLRSLIDPGDALRGSFGIMSIPVTIVIDRGGKIAAQFYGVQAEPDLLKALKQVGIE
jgi:WD40 repeat protein/outer membrane lipoprotein-sorting protein/uncharacterized caspase-like protein/peroxiredoxin